MAIYLGNLTIEQFEKRCNITLTEEERDTMNSLREDKCDLVRGNNKIHIYDIPFLIECGNKEARETIINMLLPHAKKIREPLQVGGGVE